ncbi:type II toxin-antitoxin system RelE/ParE family toxin [Flavobacterium sp.]|uniref:type II toxin-antitoxin system RelE/ParE family toxin n=1 Tax=Flavobacterium sp. TaxID=239 RepID=UPI002610E6D4|nr:type II toxin-antitoxin system RelE/ParE family toxin [Flavobacterium sp.]
MAKRVIVWTEAAKSELKYILEFYSFRNKSKTYSQNLHKKIQSELNLLMLQPEIGKKTDLINVRGLIIENHIIYYELNENHIIILSVWDARQNPNRLKL